MENGLGLVHQIRQMYGTKEMDIREYSPLVLAYMGDCIYDLLIRTLLVEDKNRPVNVLHKTATRYVKAEAQAAIVDAIMDQLTEEEQSVYRRGKNAKPHSVSKGGTVGEYHRATGLEALLGYLYLKDDMPRLMEIVKIGLEAYNGGIDLWK